jgi:hypothetical protein
LAFYAYRDMDTCDWQPFLKAAMERCPVSIEASKDKTIREAYQWLVEMSSESIYDGNRLAQPDEVVNYTAGDGAEKAITLANILCAREPEKTVQVILSTNKATLIDGAVNYEFNSAKQFDKKFNLSKTSQK